MSKKFYADITGNKQSDSKLIQRINLSEKKSSSNPQLQPRGKDFNYEINPEGGFARVCVCHSRLETRFPVSGGKNIKAFACFDLSCFEAENRHEESD